MGFRIHASIINLVILLLCSGQPSQAATYHLTGSYLDAVTNKAVPFSTYQGKYLFVEGMRTTCSHCQDEASQLDQLYTNFGNQITMLALSVYSGDDNITMTNFANSYGIHYNIGMDTNSSFQQQYTVEGTPKMFLFDGNGFLLEFWYGYTPYDTLASNITTLLASLTTSTTTSASNASGTTNLSNTSLRTSQLSRTSSSTTSSTVSLDAPFTSGFMVLAIPVFQYYNKRQRLK